MNPYWVFAYGSLMWNPGFLFVERSPATVTGYHHAFCVYSIEYRGTVQQPGLVLGLDRGGACRGLAFRVAPDQADAVRAYLYERELSYPVYEPKRLSVLLAGQPTGRAITAEAFVVDHRHPSYAGKLAPAEVAAIIRGASGNRGTNSDYLENTLRHLESLGIAEGPLHRLLAMVG